MEDRLVLMGMSCVGKTTFAESLRGQGYTPYSFDGQFSYHLTSLGGISHPRTWERILRGCTAPRFVLDNWSTGDRLGEVLFRECPGACLCVLYDTYANILGRYRVPVTTQDAHLGMYRKMYCRVPFEDYPQVRYIEVEGWDYRERTASQFRRFVGANGTPCSKTTRFM